jgi:hypothetical protein
MADDQRTPAHSGAAITILKIQPREPEAIAVASEALGVDGAWPDRHAKYGDDLSPPLTWTEVPLAQTYALVVEDPDAPRELPFVHWMIWNIPGDLTALPENIPHGAHPMTPQGAVQGVNDFGEPGYGGMRPPPGHGVHRYYFQLFALDGPLELGPETNLQTLTDAMKGRVIRQGELTGTYERRDDDVA